MLPGATQQLNPMASFNKPLDPRVQQMLQQLLVHLGGLSQPALGTLSPSALKPQESKPEQRPILGGTING